MLMNVHKKISNYLDKCDMNIDNVLNIKYMIGYIY
jgi:hypothetical protein